MIFQDFDIVFLSKDKMLNTERRDEIMSPHIMQSWKHVSLIIQMDGIFKMRKSGIHFHFTDKQ